MITRSQTTGKFRVSNTTPASGTFGTAPSVGDLVVVGFWGYLLPYWGPEQCTDNQGNRYSLVARTAIGVNAIGSIWMTVVKNTGATFTVSLTKPGGGNFYGAGCATSFTSDVGWAIHDEVSTGTGTSTSPSTGSTATTAVDDELVVAIVTSITTNQASITVESVSPAWTEEAEELSWSSYTPGEMVSRNVASAGAQSCSWTLASSAQWAAAIATFREVVVGGGPSGYTAAPRIVGGGLIG